MNVHTKKTALLPITTNKETRFQEHRMTKVSSLEGKLRKNRALREAHKTVVTDLYKQTKPRKKTAKKANLPAIVVAESNQDGDSNADDDDVFTSAEDEANLYRYTGRRSSDKSALDIAGINIAADTDDTASSTKTKLLQAENPKPCSVTNERRQSQAQIETNQILDNWTANLRSDVADDANLSVCNFLKRPSSAGIIRRTSDDSCGSTHALRPASPMELLSRSTEALNTLKDSLEDGERRPSSASRRTSLYQMTKVESDIWRHCQRVQRRKSLSLNDISISELKKCRYLRIPERYQ